MEKKKTGNGNVEKARGVLVREAEDGLAELRQLRGGMKRAVWRLGRLS